MTKRHGSHAIETPAGLQMVCEWFARCGNPTLKAVDHPVLGMVPACDRCIRMADVEPGKIHKIEVQR